MLLVTWATRASGADPADVRLALRCQQQKLDAIVFVGWRVLADSNGIAPMRIQWDSEPSDTSFWQTSGNRRAAFATSPVPFIDHGLARHSLLYLHLVREMPQEPHELATFEFEMTGLAEHLLPLRKECPDAGWSALPVSTTTEKSGDAVYFEFQVDRPVETLKVGELIYPDELRLQNIQGSVLVQVVVEASGRANLATLKVLRSSHPLFTESVKRFLLFARYRPAELKGRPVRQLVQQPFNFRLTRPVTPP
jgi:TonB family protein